MIHVPSIAIFVRHAASCKYSDDETWRRCDCCKYLRWWDGKRQIKRAAKTRSWERAEAARHELEHSFLDGKKPTAPTSEARKTVSRALELFLLEKETEGVSGGVYGKYKRELERFVKFCETQSKFFPADIDKELLTEYRSKWEELYPSSATRQMVQTRLKQFLRFMQDAGWLLQLPKLKAIKVDVAPTMPLSDKEYEKLLEKVSEEFKGDKAKRVRALVQLMRRSGLAIRDAVELERAELAHDSKKQIYRVVTSRQKTGTPVSVPLQPDVAKEILASPGDGRYFFWTGNGEPQSAVTHWQHDLRALFRAAFGEKTHFTPHCLRDTAVVGWLSGGIPIEEVSKLLGHTSVKTTEKHYAPWVTARQDRLDALVVATWQKKRSAHA